MKKKIENFIKNKILSTLKTSFGTQNKSGEMRARLIFEFYKVENTWSSINILLERNTLSL